MLVGANTFLGFLNEVGKHTTGPAHFVHLMVTEYGRKYTIDGVTPLVIEPAEATDLYTLGFRTSSSQLTETDHNYKGSLAPISVDGATLLVRADGTPVSVGTLAAEVRGSGNIAYLRSQWGDATLQKASVDKVMTVYKTNACILSRLEVWCEVDNGA